MHNWMAKKRKSKRAKEDAQPRFELGVLLRPVPVEYCLQGRRVRIRSGGSSMSEVADQGAREVGGVCQKEGASGCGKEAALGACQSAKLTGSLALVS